MGSVPTGGTIYHGDMASSQSTHRRWSGCPICKSYKHRDAGQSVRKPFSELRKIGKLRRVSRHDISDV